MYISKAFSLAFAVLAVGKPQNPTPTGPAPIPSGPGPQIPPAGTDPATVPSPAQPPPSSNPAPPASTSQAPPEQAGGPICECGYTYCASVLMAMAIPWNTQQLTEAYCSTSNAACPNGTPASSVDDAVYICLCNELEQKTGNDLDLLCGCDTCLNIGPDFRGRCETPCYPAGQKQ